MTYDITFCCQDDCTNYKCYRHWRKRPKDGREFSMAYFKDCEDKEERLNNEVQTED